MEVIPFKSVAKGLHLIRQLKRLQLQRLYYSVGEIVAFGDTGRWHALRQIEHHQRKEEADVAFIKLFNTKTQKSSENIVK